MADKSESRPVIIRRKKVVAAGHHGGAWKVAYADFVTAMMAFFLLMWLLSVASEETKLGLADYFSPTIPIHSTTGGGDGPFEGTGMFDQDVLALDETAVEGRSERSGAEVEVSPDESLWEIEDALLSGASGDALDADPLFKHIRTRLTDEGLIIDVFDIEGSALFEGETDRPNAILEQLLAMIGRVLARTENPVSITGHLARGDADIEGLDLWRLSGDRAQRARAMVVEAGILDARLARVTGKADRSPMPDTTEDARNRRIEITLLRRSDG